MTKYGICRDITGEIVMGKLESSFLDIGYLDTLSNRDSFVHRLDPRVKVLVCLVFITLVVSFNKYDISGLVPFFVYPVLLIALGDLPVKYLLRKTMLAAPFAFCVGIFNPFLDRSILFHLGSIGISGGWVSFLSIMIRFVLTVSSALILIATTGFNSVCMALERLGVPRGFVVQLMFLYRYIFVLIEQAVRLSRARSLRAFGGKGTGFRVYSNMIGQLLLRTLDRAQRIHLAMRCRGFDGEIRSVRTMYVTKRDLIFLVSCSIAFVVMRFYNIPQWLGHAAVELIR
jgi:cobalt/nickel transport system permease protein